MTYPPAGTCFINPRDDDPFETPLDRRTRGFTVLTRRGAPDWSITWDEDEDDDKDVAGWPPRLRPGGWSPPFADAAVDSWLDEHAAAAVILRPDHYVWGIARSVDELPALVDQLADQLGAPPRST